MVSGALSALRALGITQLSAEAGSGTFGPYSVTRFVCVCTGSFTVTRGIGVFGRAIEPRYLSIQPSSCASSKSPAMTSTALSGR